jgi:hypothetical protein
LHVVPVAIPAKQCPDRERVSETVDAGLGSVRSLEQPGLSEEFVKGRVDGVVDEPAAAA